MSATSYNRSTTPSAPAPDVALAPSEFGEQLGALRLCEPVALEAMTRSLAEHGQLSGILVYRDVDGFEVIDGFKRVRAARALGLGVLRATVTNVDAVGAKLLMLVANVGHGTSELEEAWLVRALHREDGLPQCEIARGLGRHKTWVCRRLLLVEALDPAVQGDVRLGLVAPRAAMALGQLPRGNQQDAAAVVIRHGMTVRQTDRWVGELRLLAGPEAIARAIRERAAGAGRSARARGPASEQGASRRASRSDADAMLLDIATLRRIGARLSARLLATPLSTFGPEAERLVVEQTEELGLVLAALAGVLEGLAEGARR